MAAIATLTGRVLIQLGEGEPVEIGTVEIPIHVQAEEPAENDDHDPYACPHGKWVAACLLDCRRKG